MIETRWTKGQGPGGQHKNKVETCCVMTDTETGVTVTVDGRSRKANEKKARKLLAKRNREKREAELAAKKKAARDEKIHDTTRIRTYDFTKNVVTDHRTKKKASLKDILVKGLLEKLR